MRKRIFACLLGTALSTSAWAQTAEEAAGTGDSADVGEIIVTAQKRSERLSDVPLSITAATGEQLANVGVSSPADLVKVVPGFTYRHKPEETAKAITEDGWVRTGDVAYQDEDGYLYICDRAKDMIISGGENVFSGEVENAILRHPAVREAAVVGIPDKKYGETVHAVVVLHEGHSLELQELRDHCRALIAPYKSPRSMEVRTAMPLSPAGKILKRDLRAPFWEKRGASI